MLRFLIHLIGDIHQPLHNTSLVNSQFPKGDKGGNLFLIKTRLKSVKDLHTFWDRGLEKISEIHAPLNAKHLAFLNDLATQFTNQFPKE